MRGGVKSVRYDLLQPQGPTYTLRPHARPDRITALPDFHARTMKVLPKPIPVP